MAVAHPYRYPTAFRRQFDRLESLVPGITDRTKDAGASTDFLEREMNGATPEEIATQSQRLRHLERLISDWLADGETTYQSQVSSEGTDDLTMGAADAPSRISHIEFEQDPRLELSSLDGGRVEGVYIREIESEGNHLSSLLSFATNRVGAPCKIASLRTPSRCERESAWALFLSTEQQLWLKLPKDLLAIQFFAERELSTSHLLPRSNSPLTAFGGPSAVKKPVAA